MTVVLRDYQDECVNVVSTSYVRDILSQLIVMPTGTGKTVVIVACALNFSWPSLILVHRDKLASQTVEKFIAAGVSPSDIGVVKGDRNELGRKFTIGSVQTLSRSSGRRLDALIKELRPQMVVIDEAHHAAAKSYKTIISKINPRLLLGFTATPMRMDKKHLVGDVFDRIVFKRSIIEMVMAGFLTPPKRKVINTETDLTGVGSKSGDYNKAQLSLVLDKNQRHERIVKAWLEHAKGRKTIVFAVDIINATKMVQAFRDAGVDAQVIHGKLSEKAQASILDAYGIREFEVLVNCEILTEGFDDPETDCVLMARPTLSEAYYIQMIGRALRLFDGKTDALIIDVTDNSLRHSINFQDIMPEARDTQAMLREMPRAQLEFFNSMQTKSKSGERGQNGWFTGNPDDFESMGIYHDPHYRWIKYNDSGFALSIGKGEAVFIIIGAISGNAVAVSSSKEWVVEHPIAPEFAFAVAEQWAMDRAKQLKLKKPYGWTERSWWDLFTTEKQTTYAKKVGVQPDKIMAITCYRIDEKIMRPKFMSVLGWLDREIQD